MWVLLRECWSAILFACKIVGTKNCMFSNLWVLNNVASTHASRMMGTHNVCVLKCVSTTLNLHVHYLWVLTSGCLCILPLNMCCGYLIVVLHCWYVLLHKACCGFVGYCIKTYLIEYLINRRSLPVGRPLPKNRPVVGLLNAFTCRAANNESLSGDSSNDHMRFWLNKCVL